MLATQRSLCSLTTRIASVRPLKNLRTDAASYVPPLRFHPFALRRRAYASWMTICAHPSGDTPNAFTAALPYGVRTALSACDPMSARAASLARSIAACVSAPTAQSSGTGSAPRGFA